MAAIPKECYTLYDELVAKRKTNTISFSEMYSALTEKKHWSIVDWSKIKSRRRAEVVGSPILIVCKKSEVIEKKPIQYDLHQADEAIKQGKMILIATSVALRWDYPTIENAHAT